MTAQRKSEAIPITASEFVAAIKAGLIEYATPFKGGNYLGRYAPRLAGSAVSLSEAGGSDAA